MTRKTWYTALFLIAIAAAAGAADFGGHVGYFGNDVQKADVGVNVMIPLGMVALFPNIDYTKQDQAGLWFGNADLALRFPSRSKSGPSYWIGAGPTYGYVSNYSSTSGGYGSRTHAVRSQQYTPPGNGGGTPPPNSGSGNGGAHTAFEQFGDTARAWGWDANAGAEWGGSSWRPYVVGRYNQVHDLKTAGVAIGLRFGH